MMDLAFAYSALPAADLPPMATKPVSPSAFLAAFTASAQALMPLVAYAFLRAADAFFDTTLPLLFFVSDACVRPPTVLAFLPEKTADLALLPFAMVLTRLAFMTFFMDFAPAFFIAPFCFMAATFFMTAFFMGSAMAIGNCPGLRPKA